MAGEGDFILILFALAVGLGAQALIRSRFGFEWVVTAVAAWLGGLTGSEYHLAGFGGWGWDIAGLHVFPTVIGGLLLAALAEMGLRALARPAGPA
ncbi:MAG TPA: hypothetical protein VMU89_20865 [Thermomicrobiaceae bacterium]|nr:hypothetical protein [Thermomicrobiaceae bacterium]